MTRDPLIIPTPNLGNVNPVLVPLVLLGAAVKFLVDHHTKPVINYQYRDGSIHSQPEQFTEQDYRDYEKALEYKRLKILKQATVKTPRPDGLGYTFEPIPDSVQRFM